MLIESTEQFQASAAIEIRRGPNEVNEVDFESLPVATRTKLRILQEHGVLRLRPSYFPFTEPSMEVDVGYTRDKSGRRIIGGAEPDGWMEILGSGMVHRKVIEACDLDPGEWQGFAFGCGIDRLAMLKYGIDDLRAFFDGDLRWLRHYGFAALDVPTLAQGVGA